MRWSDNEISLLIEKYGSIKISVLAEELNRTPSAIRWKAQDIGLKSDRSITNSTYSFDKKFFHTLGPQKCYIAGLIAADGCINTSRNAVWFFQKDRILVEYIKSSLHSNNKIYYRDRGNTEEYSILFTSKDMVNDLRVHFGITDNKSSTGLPAPNIQSLDHSLCYVAGLIDGDGSISYRKFHKNGKSKLQFTLLGSEELLNWINSLGYELSVLERSDCKGLFKMSASHKKANSILFDIYDSLEKNEIFLSEKFKKVQKHKYAKNQSYYSYQ